MLTPVLAVAGFATFLLASFALGLWIRRVPTREVAVRASRASHALFYVCLVAPGIIGLFHPGLGSYDRLLGVPSLPFRGVTVALGILVVPVALWLLGASNRSLAAIGRGSAAFRLTRSLVGSGPYRRTRNPMSLGFYLACLSAGLLSGSTTITLGTVLVLVPVHAFNLKFFEERELAIRFGEAYEEYARRAPFLIPRIRAHTGD